METSGTSRGVTAARILCGIAGGLLMLALLGPRLYNPTAAGTLVRPDRIPLLLAGLVLAQLLVMVSHELGHLLVGVLVGFRRPVVALGTGRLAAEAMVGGVRLELRRHLMRGAHVRFGKSPQGRVAAVLMVAAGPVVNGATAAVVLAHPLRGSGPAQTLALMVAAYAAVVVVTNLLPAEGHLGTGSDGRKLMRLLRPAKATEARVQHAGRVLQAGMTGEPAAALRMLDTSLADPTIAGERKTSLVAMRPYYLAALYRYAEALDGYELLGNIRPLHRHELIWLADATISADLTGQRPCTDDFSRTCGEVVGFLDVVTEVMKSGPHQWSAQRARGLLAFHREEYPLAAQHAAALVAMRPAPALVADARALIGLADVRRGRTSSARQALADARLLFPSSPWTAALERALQT